MMKVLRNILGVALAAALLSAGALGAGFDQRRGEEKKDPPKQEKIVTKEPKEQPKGNEQPRNNEQPKRGNDNRRPPF